MNHLLQIQDMTREDILSILNLADQLKFERENGIRKDYLSGKKIGMILSDLSACSKVSFETAVYELGGFGLHISEADLKNESVTSNTAIILSRYLDGLIIKTSAQQAAEKLSENASIPVVNAASDYSHPCQVLADLMSIRENKGSFKGLKMAYIGECNNITNSLIAGSVKVGINLTIACPKGYGADAEIIEWGQQNGNLAITCNVEEAVADADIVYVGGWSLNGTEKENNNRKKAFKNYVVNAETLSGAKSDVMVMRCLTAGGADGISDDVFAAHSKEIYENAENRLHIQKAVLIKLLK